MSSNYDFINKSGNDYIYIAIRRPHKPPEAGTDVFKPELLTSLTQTSTPGFAPDLVLQRPIRSGSYSSFVGTRLTGNGKYLATGDTSAEGSFTSWEFDAPTGEFTQSLTTGSTSGGIQHFFKRAPGFMDVVAYTGNGSSPRSLSHNLTVTPELLIVKKRNGSDNWLVAVPALGTNQNLLLNTNTGAANYTSFSAYSESTITLDSATSLNASGGTYIAYLFASLSGVSKIGTYTGTGSAGNNIDCGFTNGARFVLIKRTDSTGDWYVWDTARGIVSGNDPYHRLNLNNTEVTNTDYIDPLNSGFTVTSSAPAELNASGGTYIFLAIA